MSTVTVQGKFHIALDGIGLLLEGAPDRLAYEQKQAPIYGARFAQGDRDYEDFSFWWFWAQTDFSGGIKNAKKWADDATYFESEGVSVFEKSGSVLLNWRQLSSASVLNEVTFYEWGDAGGEFVAVGVNVTDQKMIVVKVSDGSVVWEDSATGAAEAIWCTGDFDGSEMYIGCATIGGGASFLKKGTTSFADVGTFAAGGGILAIVDNPDTDKLYLFTKTAGIYEHPRGTTTFTQKQTSYPYGNNSNVFGFNALLGRHIARVGDRIYFLLNETGNKRAQLWCYDIGDDAYVHIHTFGAGSNPSLIEEFNGNLYLFNTGNNRNRIEIWKYDVGATTMTLLHEIGRDGDTSAMVGGSVVRDTDSLYFAINDGSSDYQIFQLDVADNISSGITPPADFTTSIDFMGMSGVANLALFKSGISGTNKIGSYDTKPNNDRGTTGYIVTSVFDGNIPAIDKLFHDITINFDTLVTSAIIAVEYSTDGGANFTALDNVNFSDDGSIATMRFPFGSAIVAKTMMLKFIMTGAGGTTTPSVNSFSVRYIPLPDYKKIWSLNVNCGDEVKRLDGGLVETTGRELRSRLERAWWTKQVLEFQDLDYATNNINDGAGLTASATTITVDSTDLFPEQGRLRIEDEEVTYTSKTRVGFLGCTRGARGTIAKTHADDVEVNNVYKILITDIVERVPVALEDKHLEYSFGISLREA